MRIIFQFFFDNINRALLALRIVLCQILSEDPDAQQFDSGQHQDQAGERRETRHGIAPENRLHNNDDQIQDGKSKDKKADD